MTSGHDRMSAYRRAGIRQSMIMTEFTPAEGRTIGRDHEPARSGMTSMILTGVP
jgi:hypothetical protein